MKPNLFRQFLRNYFSMFLITIMVGVFALLLLDFSDHMISENLVKNTYPAEELMRDDFTAIDASEVVANGGGLQVVGEHLEVLRSEGYDLFSKKQLTTTEFTDFLAGSQRIGHPYNHDIAYNEEGKFWLVVTFPTSFRIDLAIVQNHEHASVDGAMVRRVVVSIALFSLILLAISTLVYSKISSFGITRPLRKLVEGTQQLKAGDYSARVDLNLKNEFGDLEETFNAMAEQIEHEVARREASEENRKALILHISHDLKTPLTNILGYAELWEDSPQVSMAQQEKYLGIIRKNAIKANDLVTNLFQLSKMESSEYTLDRTELDFAEFLREEIAAAIPVLEERGYPYRITIADDPALASVDPKEMSRVLQNLFSNAIKYNPPGTEISIELKKGEGDLILTFADHGVGMPSEVVTHVFHSFYRAEGSRNSETGGTGLGLTIVDRVIRAHGGSITLASQEGRGSTFTLRIPRV